MLITETYTNETRGHMIGESDAYEPFTDNIGRLFRSLQKEYGACKSAVYVDVPNGKPKRVGWYFEKTMEYEDARPSWKREDRTYLRGVWVTLLEKPDAVTRERFEMDLDA